MTILNKIYTAISRELRHVQKIPRDLLEEEDFFKKAYKIKNLISVFRKFVLDFNSIFYFHLMILLSTSFWVVLGCSVLFLLLCVSTDI